MRQRATLALLQFLLASAALAAPARITFERTLPAPHDLGKVEEIAIARAIGDHPKIEEFLEEFVGQVNRGGSLRMRDLRRGTGPADVYLDVKTFRCQTDVREGEGSTRDVDGSRVKRRQQWIDAMCMARIDVLSRDMRRLSTFYAKGEGTSPRVVQVTDEEREHALDEAAHLAAVDAATRITPRRVRESIILDDTAPAFDDAMAMIDAGRVADARSILERALRSAPRSASLHFNLGAVCEALGDRPAAGRHYVVARELAPGEPRYANELKLFARRAN